MLYESLTEQFLQDTAGAANVLVKDLMRACRLRTAWFIQMGLLAEDDVKKLHVMSLLLAAVVIEESRGGTASDMLAELEARLDEQAFNPAENSSLH